MNYRNQIFNMDCLAGLSLLPDDSVDMVLTDLPYGTTSGAWDTLLPLSDLWRQLNRVTKRNGREGLHQTQKPVALFEYLVLTYTDPGQLVLDCCMGSGTTKGACRNAGRDYVGFEIDRKYYEVAQER